MKKILLIDDESGIRESLSLLLKSEGFSVTPCENAVEAISHVDTGRNYDIIISDIKMPTLDGIEFVKEIKKRDLNPIIIMISAYATIEDAIDAIKFGADDYINKPIKIDELILRIGMVEERKRLRKENIYLKSGLDIKSDFDGIVYVSKKMSEIIELAKKASQFKTNVLITGESGTGKDLIANAIHNNSDRNDYSFIAVNCSAIPEALLESELFGYVKGAFSGADRTKHGLFEEAHLGTIFLDEIGELPMTLQTKLLRVLQEREIRRLGDTKTTHIDVRIIAATSRNLEEDINFGKFRDDLYFRLNVFPIHIPPLRERREDIEPLTKHFLEKYSKLLKYEVLEISDIAMNKLTNYDWKGNIRELENFIERTIILSESETINNIDLKPDNTSEKNVINNWLETLSLEEAKNEIEKEYIKKALNQTRGNRTKAAELLGISRRALLYKLKEYGDSVG